MTAMETIKPNNSITRQLSRRIVLLVLIAVSGVFGTIGLSFWVTLQQVQGQMDDITDEAATIFNLFVLQAQESLLARSNGIAIEEISESSLLLILSQSSAILDVYTVDFEGRILAQQSVTGRDGPDLFNHSEWVETPPNFGEMVTSPIIFEGDKPVLDVVVLINDDIGLSSGLLVARLDLTTLWDTTLDIRVGETGYAYITDDAGQLIAFRNRRLVGRLLPELIGQTPQAISETWLDYYRNVDGVWVLASAQTIQTVPWFTIVEQSVGEALTPVYTPALILIIVLISTGILLSGTTRFTRNRILQPLEALSGAVAELGQGRFRGDLAVKNNDELGLLANAFNDMAGQLRELLSTLEERVSIRTRDMELSSEVARQVTTELDIERLLPRLAEKTRQTFDLYFVSVFLYDAATERLVLAVGTGQAGQNMLTNNINYHINARRSLVAKASREKRHVVINDVSQEATFAPNKFLPDTQSEIVLPMLVGNKLIGVLGMQAAIKDRFTPDDVEIFTTLAEQVAIAVNNAQLYATQTQLTEELRQADQIKTQFLASMSHELRTPLNGIMNFTELVSSGMMGEVNEEQKELLEQSLDSSKHLLSLINDVLDITKIQAGKLNLFIEDNINIRDELNSAINLIKPMLREEYVTLVEDIDDNLPFIRGDRRRIRQIFLNLASNAVKFTQKGTITISAKHQTDHILFAVIDTGIGISEEMQGAIFEPFVQTVDGTKVAEGTGLGLPITKNLIEAHNGRLWIESEPGEGSAFFATLPVQVAELMAVAEV